MDTQLYELHVTPLPDQGTASAEAAPQGLVWAPV